MGSFPQEITNKNHRRHIKDARIGMETWHECMGAIVESLKEASKK